MKRDLRRESYSWEGTQRFLKRPFRVALAGGRARHQHGGPPRHSNARCFLCQKPLRLVWDLDLQDPVLPDVLRETYPKLTRLPLYYCFDCPEATTYLVKSDKTLASLAPQTDGGDGTPYQEDDAAPAELPKKGLKLIRIPSIIDGLMTLEREIGCDEIDPEADRLTWAFCNEGRDARRLGPFSQLGGHPGLPQGDLVMACPNPKCPGLEFAEQEAFRMKPLAVIEQDGLDGVRGVAPLAYHACCVCGALQGVFQCT